MEKRKAEVALEEVERPTCKILFRRKEDAELKPSCHDILLHGNYRDPFAVISRLFNASLPRIQP